ncbi:hypothetical protein ADUPG1_013266, partial [Aduncisulcus paluster]
EEECGIENRRGLGGNSHCERVLPERGRAPIARDRSDGFVTPLVPPQYGPECREPSSSIKHSEDHDK